MLADGVILMRLADSEAAASRRPHAAQISAAAADALAVAPPQATVRGRMMIACSSRAIDLR